MRWQSNRRYTYNRAVGRVVLVGTEYRLLDKRGRYHQIDQARAQDIHEAEGLLPGRGRPALYGDEPCESYRITMPVRLWALLAKPYSTSIAHLIEHAERPNP